MKQNVQVFMMAVAFDLYWTLVVLFRERGLFLWLALAILACLMLSPAHRLYALNDEPGLTNARPVRPPGVNGQNLLH